MCPFETYDDRAFRKHLKAHQKENINERLGVKGTKKRQKIRHMLMENADTEKSLLPRPK
jgi:hypothetical protein